MAQSKRVRPRHNNKKKLPWVSMQMYRVPLNPEQAVLTCCDGQGRNVQQTLTQQVQCNNLGSLGITCGTLIGNASS